MTQIDLNPVVFPLVNFFPNVIDLDLRPNWLKVGANNPQSRLIVAFAC